jgi:hypothetical protein
MALSCLVSASDYHNGHPTHDQTVQNIQGDIFVGMKKPQELFYFFSIVNATLFKSVLKNRVAPLVTSAATLLSTPSNQPLAFLNIAFSQSGLTALGNTDNLGDTQFAGGMYADATSLGDVQTDYEPAFQGTSIHGVFLIGSDQSSYIDNLLSTINGYFGNSIAFKTQLSGAARPGSNAGHERTSSPSKPCSRSTLISERRFWLLGWN